MTPRAELSAVEIARQLVRLAYGDLTPFIDDKGYLTCSLRDLPAAAAVQVAEITTITTAAGTRIKLRAWGAAHTCRALTLVQQLARHPDPAVRQALHDERQTLLGDQRLTTGRQTARRRTRRHHAPPHRCRVVVTHAQTSSPWIQ